jgi:hypothetical protein
MRKLKDVLRLKLVGGQSHQEIATALGIAKGSVTKYTGLAASAGLDWGAIDAMSETDLEHRLFGSSFASTFARPDYGRMHQELRRKGVTGAGKSWLACALAQHACRRGQSAYYQRVPRLGEELRIRHANGTFTRWLEALKNTDVLLLDDWGMTAMDAQTRADLLEIIDDRANARATIITSQLPIEHWHEWIGDATIADAMLDRLMQNNHRFTLTGESMRKKTVTKAKTSAAATTPEGA